MRLYGVRTSSDADAMDDMHSDFIKNMLLCGTIFARIYYFYRRLLGSLRMPVCFQSESIMIGVIFSTTL